MGRTIGRGALGCGSRRLSLGTAAFVLATGSAAHAQPPPRDRPPAPAGGPIYVHRDPASEAITLGRARMAKGDYAGALEAFDAALRTSVDPTVRRDRGLCHEQLGHPFPAIDDFRVYLTALPDAADADDIRGRLNQLEIANGLGGTGTGGESTGTTAPATGTTSSHEDPFAVDPNDPNAKSSGAVPGSGDRARVGNYEQELVLNERWDEAESSPLRRGTGLVFGAYGRGFAGSANGVYGFGEGATLRGSLGPVSTLYGEVGYISYQSGSDPATGEREGGLSLGFGYEARLRLDQFASNAILLGLAVSYERVTDSNTQANYNVLDPRAKLGYRHVFGPGFGIEIGAEVATPLYLNGPGEVAQSQTVLAYSPAGVATPLITFGGTLALLLGF